MSNLPPDWRPEPREHDDRCQTNCYVAQWSTDNRGDDETPCGHEWAHDCTCDELAEQDAEREAEAYAEYLYDREP